MSDGGVTGTRPIFALIRFAFADVKTVGEDGEIFIRCDVGTVGKLPFGGSVGVVAEIVVGERLGLRRRVVEFDPIGVIVEVGDVRERPHV